MKERKGLKKYSTIINNFLSLFVLQGLNYILPLITVPYLVRTLGPEKYGVTVFATAFITYFQIITDYGFNLSATRKISMNKKYKKKIEEIFNSVMLIKLALTILCFIVMLVIVFCFKRFQADYKVYIYTYGMIIGNFLFPVWFFQGIEKMKYITIVNVIGKVMFTIFIFIFVRTSKDYLNVALLNSFSYILIGIISLLIVKIRFKIKFRIPKTSIIKKDIKEGWYIFTTSFLTNILTSTGTFILGLFVNEKVVGYYGAIDKIVKALVSMFSPVTQAIFPHISELFKYSHKEAKNEIIKFSKYVMFFTTIMCIVIVLFNKTIIYILYGNRYIMYSHILAYMSVWIFLSILNNFIGIQYLIGSGNGKYYSRAFTIASIITLILYIGTVEFISYNSIILGSVVGELALTISMIYFIKSKLSNDNSCKGDVVNEQN